MAHDDKGQAELAAMIQGQMSLQLQSVADWVPRLGS
jgi:hypothetical protein